MQEFLRNLLIYVLFYECCAFFGELCDFSWIVRLDAIWSRLCEIYQKAWVEETEVEEEEEYETDSDAQYPIADNCEEDSLDDLVFLRAVTTQSGRMVRVVQREWFR